VRKSDDVPRDALDREHRLQAFADTFNRRMGA
jgi:hypothetical protein